MGLPLFPRYLALLLLLAALGCATHPARSTWVQDHGGLAEAKDQEHVRRIVGRIIPKHSTRQRQLTVHVLNASESAAFSWDDGQIYITLGLVSILDEEELLAVVAHELGHLLGDDHAQVISALQRCQQDLDGETRADLIGVELLRAHGLSPDAMPRMLQRIITSHCWSFECEAKLQQRLDCLTSRSD